MISQLVARISGHRDRAAIVDAGRVFTYADLDAASSRVASGLLSGTHDLDEARVAFLIPPGFEYVAMLVGIWRAGGIAVPLAVSHPPAELDYVIRDSAAAIVVSDTLSAPMMLPLAYDAGARFQTASDLLSTSAGTEALPDASAVRRALILYTSGTTGRPKGVVTTHANLEAQIASLVTAWEWSADDRVLLVLPLHHVHGIVNVVGSALGPARSARPRRASMPRRRGIASRRASSPCSRRCRPSTTGSSPRGTRRRPRSNTRARGDAAVSGS